MTSQHKTYQQLSRKNVQTKRDSHPETLTPKETLRERDRFSKTQPVSNQHDIQFANFPPRATIDNVSRSSVAQPKLQIGEVGDKYEQEADRVAKATVEQINAPESEQVQRDIFPQEKEELQMKSLESKQPILQAQPMPKISPLQTPKISLQAKNRGGKVNRDLENNIHRGKSGGQSLAPELQAKMGQAMGADFSNVKVHTDTHSDRLNQSLQARAFTTGNHVFFKKGEYNPSNTRGQELIAHELTHVVQQNSNTVQRKTADTQIVQCGWFTKTQSIDKQTDIGERINYVRENFELVLQYPRAYEPLLKISQKAFVEEGVRFLYDYLECKQNNSPQELEQLYDRYIQEYQTYTVNISTSERNKLYAIRNNPNQAFSIENFKKSYHEVVFIVEKRLLSDKQKNSLRHEGSYKFLCDISNRIGY